MDATTKTLIDSITIKCDPPKKLSSGREVSVFYDCAALSMADLSRLAALAVGHLEEDDFDMVVGIAYSGILFATSIAGGREVSIIEKEGTVYGANIKGMKALIVDDVVCSGSHLKKGRKIIESLGAKVVGYACIVDRSQGMSDIEGIPLYPAFQANLE